MHIIRSLEELEHTRDAWGPLADRLENPFLAHDWILSCAETLHEEADLRVAVLHTAEGAAAVAPLAAVRRHGYERLELIGAWMLGEPSGLLYSDEEALTMLVRRLVRLGRPLVLRGLETEAATLQAFRRVVAERRLNLLLTRPPRTSATLPIRTAWPAFMQSVSSKMRQDVRRLLARAQAMGDTRFEVLAPTPAEVPRIMDTVVQVEAAGWKSRQGTSLAHRDRLRRFYETFASRAAQRGTLRVDLLHIGARTAAVQLSLEMYRRLWLLKIDFDETFAWCSPGFLLMHESIRLAHERQLASVEFLGHEEPWQARWRPSTHTYTSALVYPFTPRGLSSFAIDALGRARRVMASRWGAHRT